MHDAIITAIPVLLLIAAATTLIVIMRRPVEPFGSTSPGTLTQLESTRVPTEASVQAYRDWLMQRDRDIKNMTESDLALGGPLWPVMRIGAYA